MGIQNQNVCAWYILLKLEFRQIFRNVLSSYGYLNHKYLYQGYPWDIFIPFLYGPPGLPPWEPCCPFADH